MMNVRSNQVRTSDDDVRPGPEKSTKTGPKEVFFYCSAVAYRSHSDPTSRVRFRCLSLRFM